ncbi:MAG: MlaD family protein [Candidatus Firestonebacteria bacterium]|nr:MlaD family protein [Candidatus Firestonebacteria bacterium]
MSLSNEVKVGIFTIVAAGILLAGTIYIGGFTFFRQGYKINVVFDSAPDLKARSKVKYGGGVNIGNVSSLTLIEDNNVIRNNVELFIMKGFKIRNDSYISISSTGVMGEKFVNISGGTGNAPYLEAGQRIYGKSSGGIDSALESMSRASAELKEVLGALNKIVSGVESSLVGSVQNVNELTKATRNIVEKSTPAITRSVDNFEKTSSELAQATKNLQELTAQLNTIIKDVNKADLPKTMENFNKVSVKLDETISSLDSAAKKVDKGDGTLAVLINDKKMAEDLRSFIKDVKDNPWKILWKK